MSGIEPDRSRLNEQLEQVKPSALSPEEWTTLLADISQLLDITWKHAAYLADAVAHEVLDGVKRPTTVTKTRAIHSRDEMFKQVRADSFDRVVRVKNALQRIAHAAGVVDASGVLDEELTTVEEIDTAERRRG